MYPKLQSQGIYGGDNTGSCAEYVYYLGHEIRWKKENGKRNEIIPFYDRNGETVLPTTIINYIDSNKKGLHVEDTKFFSLTINPSEKEIKKLGKNRDERLKSLQDLVDKTMDRYAQGFGKAGIKGRNDLLYFYTIHEYREDDDSVLRPGLHAHIIVSRKSLDGKTKLSPMTNLRNGTAGVIKSGFDRDSFYRDCESIFDQVYKYQRPISESYDYLNTMKHGSDEAKSAMIRAAVQEEDIFKSVSNTLASRAGRLAREAATEAAKRQRETVQARLSEDKRKKNEFWNSYNSYYRPMLDELNAACKDTFALYEHLKRQKGEVGEEVSQSYKELKNIYNQISHQRKEMDNDVVYHDLIRSFIGLIGYADPLSILVVILVLLIIIEIGKEADREALRAAYEKANRVYDRIDSLKGQQEMLRFAQRDTLRQYIEVKERKAELQQHLSQLRKELDTPVQSEIDLDALNRELEARKSAPKENTIGQALNALGVYGAVMAAETKLALDLELLTDNTDIEPVMHPNGGVADLVINSHGTESLASNTFSDEKLTAMLEKWGMLTGQTPAHRIPPAAATNESQDIIQTTIKQQKTWTTKNLPTPLKRSPSSSRQQKSSKEPQKKPSQHWQKR